VTTMFILLKKVVEDTLQSLGQSEPRTRQSIVKPAHHRHFLIAYTGSHSLPVLWSHTKAKSISELRHVCISSSITWNQFFFLGSEFGKELWVKILRIIWKF